MHIVELSYVKFCIFILSIENVKVELRNVCKTKGIPISVEEQHFVHVGVYFGVEREITNLSFSFA